MSNAIAEPDDAFEAYCRENNFTSEEERQNAFPIYMLDSTGWDGHTFSLTDDELVFIRNSNEVVEWLRLYQMSGQNEALQAAFNSLNNLKPIPNSLATQIYEV